MNKQLLTLLVLCLCAYTGLSQPTESPVDHMNSFTRRDQELSQKYLSYMSEVAHGHRARKMEKRRQELITEIRQSLTEISRTKPYKGDASLRDAYKTYFDILLKVFNEDYHKIVNMEEIAEQSYDNMEAYLLAQEKAGEVLDSARARIHPIYNTFAANNNVRLVDDGVESRTEKKVKKVSMVTHYMNKLFLIFFKSYKQEMYVLDAYNRKDVNSIEQNRTTLIKFAGEGLAKLDTMKAFEGDGSLIVACKKVLEFHKNEAEQYIPGLRDFQLKSDEFDKMKKAFDAKPANKRAQTDVDQYNKAVRDINAILETTNKNLGTLNNLRQKNLELWNDTKVRFMDIHTPKG